MAADGLGSPRIATTLGKTIEGVKKCKRRIRGKLNDAGTMQEAIQIGRDREIIR